MAVVEILWKPSTRPLDCLNFVRMLKELGIGVIFETENINTMSQESELILSVLSSLAQEEASSMSSNIRWASQKRYKQGKFQIASRKFLGYDYDKNKGLVINKVEAELVKRIFSEYLNGKGSTAIVKGLNNDNIPTITGTTMSL